MEFEDVLEEIGEFNRYQKHLILVFMGPVAALTAFFYLNNLFIISIPDHWCRVPELESFNLTVEQEHFLVRPQADPSCSVYNVNYTDILSASPGNWTIPENATISKCTNGWNYDRTNYDFTAATEWNLVCDDRHYYSFILTMFSVGSIIGTPIYGSLSDRFGRKYTFYIVVIVSAVTGIASVLTTNFTAFVVLKTICGSMMPSLFQIPYIIILEIIGPQMRARVNIMANMAWTAGMCVLPLVAWLCRDYIKLGLVTSSLIILSFFYWTILPESPRWLLLTGKYDEATKVIAKIAKTNGKNIDTEDIAYQLQTLGERVKKENTSKTKEDFNIWKYPQLRKKFLIITYAWMANHAVYYGLQINGHNLAGNEFLNFFLLSLAEVPAYPCSWIFMEKIGRRWCSVSSFILSGVANIVSAAYIESGVVSSFVAKFFISVSFMSMYQQASELYPTSTRAFSMGLSSTCSTVVALGVPYLVYLNIYGTYIPFLIFVFLSVTAGILSSFLPETLNEILPQTAQDSENFGRNQKFLSWKKQKRMSVQVEMAPTSRKNTYNSSDDCTANGL